MHWKGSAATRVLVVGHHDTVFPKGTVARRGFSRDGDVARGPGIFDMKAGIVQAIHAVAALDDRSHVEILLSADVIENLVCQRVEEHAVNGEVASLSIFDWRTESHRGRATSVNVLTITSKRGDFHGAFGSASNGRRLGPRT